MAETAKNAISAKTLTIIIKFVAQKSEVMIIGRTKESKGNQTGIRFKILRVCCSIRPATGGKTFLIRETFDYKFTFSHSGMANGNKHDQLAAWRQSLEEYGMHLTQTPRDWMEAFGCLRTLIKDSCEKRKVISLTKCHGWTPLAPSLSMRWNSSGTVGPQPERM